jgi:hypothetical protein
LEADADGDGYNNLVEYAQGMEPLRADPGPNVLIALTNLAAAGQPAADALVVRFRARNADADPNLRFVLDVSTNLGHWACSVPTNCTNFVLLEQQPVAPAISQQTYQDLNWSTNSAERYYRLRIGHVAESPPIVGLAEPRPAYFLDTNTPSLFVTNAPMDICWTAQDANGCVVRTEVYSTNALSRVARMLGYSNGGSCWTWSDPELGTNTVWVRVIDEYGVGRTSLDSHG